MRYLLLLLILLQGAEAYPKTDSTHHPIQPSSTSYSNDSASYYKGEADALKLHIDNTKEGRWTNSTIISVFSVLIAVSALLFTFLNYKREGAYKRVNFAAEVNKLQLANPDLRAMYDAEQKHFLQEFSVENATALTFTGTCSINILTGTAATISGDGTVEIDRVQHQITGSEPFIKQFKGGEIIALTGSLSFKMAPAGSVARVQMLPPELAAKIRAFGFFLINNFEVLFNKTKFANKPEAKYWEVYFIALMKRSNMFTKQVEEVLNHTEPQFHIKYIQKLRKLHQSAITNA